MYTALSPFSTSYLRILTDKLARLPCPSFDAVLQTLRTSDPSRLGEPMHKTFLMIVTVLRCADPSI